MLLTRAKNLYYERYCLSFYGDIVDFLLTNCQRKTTVEQDLAMLKDMDGSDGKPKMAWGMRMAFVYRIEKKLILRNQAQLISLFKDILKDTEKSLLEAKGGSDETFRKLTLKETSDEQAQQQKADNTAERVKLDEAYWYRRLYNSDYLRQVYCMVKDGSHL